MKNGRSIFSAVWLLALAALALAGCGFDSEASGGSITFAFGPSARALEGDATYRVEVYYGPDMFAERTTSDETIVFEALPTGRATVFVAQGSGSGAGFVAERYGSFDMTIVPGDNNPAAVTLAAVPFTAAAGLEGVGVSSVVTLGGGIFAATASGELKRATLGSGGFFASEGPAVPAGMSSLSLSVAPYFGETDYEMQVWVNGTWSPGAPYGSGGILPWIGDSLDEQFASGLMGAPWVGDPSAFTVLRSGSLAVPSLVAADDGLSIFYQRNGGLGGVYVLRSEEADRAAWPWITNQIDLSAALGELGAGQEPILDFAAAGDAAYVVTTVTTLRASADLLREVNLDVQSVLESDYVVFTAGISSPIISVAVHSGAAETVYLGTVNGLWRGAAGTSTFFEGDPERIDATVGYRIETLSVSPDGLHVAFVSSRSGTPDALAVMPTGDPGALRIYRTMEGLPGSALAALAWLGDSTLLVAGSGGLAALQIATD